MRTFSIILPLILSGTVLFAGPEQIIKQRAKDIRDQNNARQGVPPATAPTVARPATPAIAAMPPQPPLNRLTTDVLSLKTNTPVTPAQVQSFARNLAAAAQGPRKPSSGTLTKFANDLLPALASHPLSPNTRSRLLQNAMAVVNGNGVTQAQLNDVILDLQSLLKSGGTPESTAKLVADDARAIAREVHPAAQ